jgi:hypothetical protein
VLDCDIARETYSILVLGSGTQHAPDEPHAAAIWRQRLRQRIDARMEPMGVVVAEGESCRSDTPRQFTVYVDDWRQVDEVVRRLAEVIRAENLAVPFSFRLTPISADL